MVWRRLAYGSPATIIAAHHMGVHHKSAWERPKVAAAQGQTPEVSALTQRSSAAAPRMARGVQGRMFRSDPRHGSDLAR
jgi:hypothetical protein